MFPVLLAVFLATALLALGALRLGHVALGWSLVGLLVGASGALVLADWLGVGTCGPGR